VDWRLARTGRGINEPPSLAREFARRVALFRAALTADGAPLRRPQLGIDQSAGRTMPYGVCWAVAELTEAERLIRETAEGRQLLRAMREVLPAFRPFDNSDYYVDALMSKAYASMCADDRLALFRRVLQLVWVDADLPPPAITDETIMHLSERAGISIMPEGHAQPGAAATGRFADTSVARSERTPDA